MSEIFTRQKVKLSSLKFNTGQVPGLPKNPRFIRDANFARICTSIRETPEFMEVREPLAYNYAGVLVVIAGEMRVRGAKEEGVKEVWCKVFPESTTVEKLCEYAIKDNAHYGEWDREALANEWDAGLLDDWGVGTTWEEVPEYPNEDDLIGEKKGLPPTIKITFADIGQIQKAENEVIEMMQRYQGSFYSLSCGEV